MNQIIAKQNADRLANLSMMFCITNELPMSEDLIHHLTGTVMYNLAKWYEENGKTFNPAEELIEDDALVAAFTRVQEIVVLAAISAQTGIGMEGLGL